MDKLLTKCLIIVVIGMTINVLPVKAKKKQPNVLFIIVDDLRPELNCYGMEYIQSPNIDKLAESGCMFTRSYCNMPVCGASRASLLTGMYPNRVRFTSYKTYADEDAPGVVTLPRQFKQNGYSTYSYGKVFHHLDDAVESWSETPWRADYPNNIHIQEYWRDYRNEENLHTKDEDMPGGAAGPAWERGKVGDDAYYDGKTAEKAIDKLKSLSKADKPFFMAVGFVKPHLPFNSPSDYWEKYPQEDIQLATNNYMPENAPKEANFNSHELRGYTNIPNDKEPLVDSIAYPLKQGYYACVTYVDKLIGEVLSQVEESGLGKNTIIVLLGDHGWSLGEHTHWGKHTCFHNSLHTPLIIKVPGMKPLTQNQVVSYIDIFPTLCELSGISKPNHLQGKSLVKTMKGSSDKSAIAFCRYPNGETIVTDRYTYTEYYDKTGKYLSNMMYDLRLDPMENKNISGLPESAEVEKNLQKKLQKHIKKLNSLQNDHE